MSRFKTIIEVDGGYHEEENQQFIDAQRTNDLNALGYRIVRFTNKEIIENLANVIQQLQSYIAEAQVPRPNGEGDLGGGAPNFNYIMGNLPFVGTYSRHFGHATFNKAMFKLYLDTFRRQYYIYWNFKPKNWFSMCISKTRVHCPKQKSFELHLLEVQSFPPGTQNLKNAPTRRIINLNSITEFNNMQNYLLQLLQIHRLHP